MDTVMHNWYLLLSETLLAEPWGRAVHLAWESSTPEEMVGKRAQSWVFREGFEHRCTSELDLEAKAGL